MNARRTGFVLIRRREIFREGELELSAIFEFLE